MPLYKRAVDIVERRIGEQLDLAAKLTGLAYCFQLQDKFSDAKPVYRRALEICEKHPETPDDELTDNLIALANCHLATGEYALARPLYQRALEYKQNKFDPKDQELASRIETLLKHMEHTPV